MRVSDEQGAYIVSKGAVDWGSGEELHLRAQIVEPLFAQVAFIAGDTWLEGHAISNCQALHGLANLFNDSGALVSDHHRLLHNEVPAPQMLHHIQETQHYFDSSQHRHMLSCLFPTMAKMFSRKKQKTRDPRGKREVFPGHMAQMQSCDCISAKNKSSGRRLLSHTTTFHFSKHISV